MSRRPQRLDVQSFPPLSGNPLAELVENRNRDPGPGACERRAAYMRYSYGVQTEEAIAAIGLASPGGVIEVGAGLGYWARLLHEHGVDVLAVDIEPPPSKANEIFAGVDPWFPVERSDHTIVEHHADRTLLLVWPTRDEDWAADSVERFHRSGGRTLIYVGEPLGGRTGDDRFHALVGGADRCWACAYALSNAPCTCGAEPVWEEQVQIDLPTWRGFDDRLVIYERRDGAARRPSDDGIDPAAELAPPGASRRWRRLRRRRTT